jgi:hypothetical protein
MNDCTASRSIETDFRPDLFESLDRGGKFHTGQLDRLPRDALGVIANALQLEIDFDRRVGKAQVLCRWLLSDKEFKAQADRPRARVSSTFGL